MPFQKGQSGNPGGRPKAGWTMREEYIKALERQTADGTPLKQGVAEALVDRALEGDVIAIREVNNRIDGMSPQSIDAQVQGAFELIIKDYTDDDNSPEETEGSN